MADHYYDHNDLARFPDIGKNSPDLAAKFFEWYGAVFADGALWRGKNRSSLLPWRTRCSVPIA